MLRVPLRIAYRGLRTTDKSLRVTALEYLRSVLPPEISKPHPSGPAALESIVLNLEQLKAGKLSEPGT